MDDVGPGQMADSEVEALLADLDGLLERVDALPGQDGELVRTAVAALAEVYGEALSRTLGGIEAETRRRLADDVLVGHLMALHGLHPDPPEVRVEQAIAQIQEQLHGRGSVELSALEAGVATVTVASAGCGSEDLSAAVRDILLGVAPELARVDTAKPPPAPTLVRIEPIRRSALR
jgi:hypothetical protein